MVEVDVGVDQLTSAGLPRDILQESGENGLAAFQGGCHDHPVGGDAAQFSRVQISHDHHFPADEFAGLVGFGDAGDDGARLGFGDVDFEVEQLIGALHGLGGETWPTRRSTFTKSSMAIGGGPAVRPAGGAALPRSFACWRVTFLRAGAFSRQPL